MIKKLIYYVGWVVKCKIFGRKIPLSSSIILTDKCNLVCKHCCVANLGYQSLSFDEVKDLIRRLFLTGSRMLVITGGEPFAWSSNEKSLDDVVKFAKKLGFFRVVICTNGTFKLDSLADYLWVSMDGSEEKHNDIRGDIYHQVWNNINRSVHKKIYINFTVSKLNQNTFIEDSEQILKNKRIRGIFFHMFTPYIGSDKSLLLLKDEKHRVLEQLLQFKRRYPVKVSNTFCGIKYLLRDNWKRPVWSSVVINQGNIVDCCCREGIYDEQTCALCGCSPAVETYALEKLKISAIIENFRFL